MCGRNDHGLELTWGGVAMDEPLPFHIETVASSTFCHSPSHSMMPTSCHLRLLSMAMRPATDWIMASKWRRTVPRRAITVVQSNAKRHCKLRYPAAASAPHRMCCQSHLAIVQQSQTLRTRLLIDLQHKVPRIAPNPVARLTDTPAAICNDDNADGYRLTLGGGGRARRGVRNICGVIRILMYDVCVFYCEHIGPWIIR